MKKLLFPLLASLLIVFFAAHARASQAANQAPGGKAAHAPVFQPPVVSGDVSGAASDDAEDSVVYEKLEGAFFTAEAPQGEWHVEEINEGSAAIVSADRSAVLTVTTAPLGRITLREVAECLAEQHRGLRALKRIESDPLNEVWEYRGVSFRQRLYAQVFSLGKDRYGVISIIGDPDAFDTAEIFNSIRFK